MPISNNQSHLPDKSMECVCGSQKSYAECCMPFHHGIAKPETAEQLMRSRFSAFELLLEEYLMDSWDKVTRPGHIDFTPGLHWTKLVINGRKQGRKKDQQGWVTFVAYYQLGSEQGHLHEKSFFTRNEQGEWQYVDGEIKN
ncbi:YchJ family protein [Thiomicrorhabdus immobilis]|nr:YchJ family metal-binding protein [Thiomicrorhabdus immobilis]